MKKIQDVPIWNNGVLKNAGYLDVKLSNMIFGKSASFDFSLYTAQETVLPEGIGRGEILVSGALLMDGNDYTNWGDDDNYVYTWAASKLNLVII